MKKRGVEGSFKLDGGKLNGENGEGRNMAVCHVTVES